MLYGPEHGLRPGMHSKFCCCGESSTGVHQTQVTTTVLRVVCTECTLLCLVHHLLTKGIESPTAGVGVCASPCSSIAFCVLVYFSQVHMCLVLTWLKENQPFYCYGAFHP